MGNDSGSKPEADRIIANVSPKDLHEIFKKNLHFQAKQLVAPYVGKWIRASGEVDDIIIHETYITIYLEGQISYAVYHFDPAWKGRIEILKAADRINILGQIEKVDTSGVNLEHCELLDESGSPLLEAPNQNQSEATTQNEHYKNAPSNISSPQHNTIRSLLFKTSGEGALALLAWVMADDVVVAHPILAHWLRFLTGALILAAVLTPFYQFLTNKKRVLAIYAALVVALGLVFFLEEKSESDARDATTFTSLPDGRILIDKDPKFLSDIFSENTDIEADRLVEPYIGKWMKISGDVYDISDRDFGDLMYVSIMDKGGNPFGMSIALGMGFNRDTWKDRLELLHPGDHITVIGQIKSASRIGVQFDKCELK